jgi:hypothetical protein
MSVQKQFDLHPIPAVSVLRSVVLLLAVAALSVPAAAADSRIRGRAVTPIETHEHQGVTPRPPEKPGGVTRALRRFEYVAAEGEELVFREPTVVRWEPRIASIDGEMRERTFEAGERQVCNAVTFSAVGVGGGIWEYVCTRLVEAITIPELMPQTTGTPYVDPRLQMGARRGYAREVLGPSLGAHQWRPGPGGEFRISCHVSHMGFEDPILAPGREFWHHHTFAGNARVDRHTKDMRDKPDAGLCAGGNINRTAYWFPSVIDTRFGMPIVPAGTMIYYKGDPDSLPSKNLRMITGDPMRKTPRDPNVFPVSMWTCYLPDGKTLTQGLQDEIPAACPVGGRIVWTVGFPQCWDGQNDDAADHKSHVWSRAHNKPGMALLRNDCPATHPKRLFDLVINVHYLVRHGDDVSRWRLSSDAYEWSKPAGYSAHADWWNGWDMEFLAAIKRECHDKNRNCGTDNAPDTRRMNLK